MMIKNLTALLLSIPFFNATAATIEIDRTIDHVWKKISFQPVEHRDWLYIHPTRGCSVTFKHISIHLEEYGWMTLYRGQKEISGPTKFAFPQEVQERLGGEGGRYDALEYQSTTLCNRTMNAGDIIYKAAPRDTEDYMAFATANAKMPVCSANVTELVTSELEAGSTSQEHPVVTEVVGEEDCVIGVDQPEVALGTGVKAIYKNGTMRVIADSDANAGEYNGVMTVTISVK